MVAVLKFLSISTVAGLALSYGLHLFHGSRNQVSYACDRYTAGTGLDSDGSKFEDFASFYPYYLCEHVKPRTKLFHFIATFNATAILGKLIFGRTEWAWLAAGLLQGYGLAWYSHFTVEMNKPATWQYPWLSYTSDNRLFIESLLGYHALW